MNARHDTGRGRSHGLFAERTDVNRKCVKEILEQPMMDGSIPCIDELPIATPTS